MPPSFPWLSDNSPGRAGTPAPSIPQHIVSAAGAAGASSDPSSDAIAEPRRFATRSIHFAFRPNPSSRLASVAARSKLVSAASGAAAHSRPGVARVPDRPPTPNSASSGQRPPFAQPRVQYPRTTRSRPGSHSVVSGRNRRTIGSPHSPHRNRSRSASSSVGSADAPDDAPARSALRVPLSNSMKFPRDDSAARASGDIIALSTASRRKSNAPLPAPPPQATIPSVTAIPFARFR